MCLLARIAQDVGTAKDPFEWFQYGVLGFILVGLLTGWLWPKPAVDRLVEENRQLREQQAKQIEALTGEVRALRATMDRSRHERSS